MSLKIVFAALVYHDRGPIKGKPLTLNQVVGSVNSIANMHATTHSVNTAFKNPPEEEYLDALQISQEDLDVEVDTTIIGLMAAETLLSSN